MKKTNKTNPLFLEEITAVPAEIREHNQDQIYSDTDFDHRNDFLIFPCHDTLMVRMNFLNRRSLDNPRGAGLRRNVRVLLVDTTQNSIYSADELTVDMAKGRLSLISTASVPIDYETIDIRHNYLLEVRDETGNARIGAKEIRFFHWHSCGYGLDELFRPAKGGIMEHLGFCYYRSVPHDANSVFKIRFALKSDTAEEPERLPELEIITHYPDGYREQHFCKVIRCGEDYIEYRAEAPFIPQSWRRGITYVELRCLREAVAGFVVNTDGSYEVGEFTGDYVKAFDVYSILDATERFEQSMRREDAYDDEEFDRRLDEFIANEKKDTTQYEADEKEADRNESLAEMLKSLTGLAGVKQRLATYEKVVRFNKLRELNGLAPLSAPLHAMFLGSPGTGKTTVANMMGKMLADAGVLSKGHVVRRERATLLGQYYNSEATNTQQAIEEAQGGILLIDEAYQLFQPGDAKDPGKFVIESLLTALSDESKRDWMLILAGYPEEMKRMFEMNPGLKSRIPESNMYYFEDFSEKELMEVAEKYLHTNNYTLTSEAREALLHRLEADYACRDKTFGNARHVINLIQTDIIPAMATRVVSGGETTTKILSEIQASDIPSPQKPAGRPITRIGYRA